jgi:hypothetical protein
LLPLLKIYYSTGREKNQDTRRVGSNSSFRHGRTRMDTVKLRSWEAGKLRGKEEEEKKKRNCE